MNGISWGILGTPEHNFPLRTDPFSERCPSRVLLDHVTSKWGVLILVALSQKTLRWGELHRAIGGISEKMLAQTLKLLAADGLVARNSYGTVPPRVDYSLTVAGTELSEILIPLVRWTAERTSASIRHEHPESE